MHYSQRLPELPIILDTLNELFTDLGLTQLSNNRKNRAMYLTPDKNRLDISFDYFHQNHKKDMYNLKISLSDLNGDKTLNTFNAMLITENQIPNSLENGLKSVIPDIYVL